ncbi:unnamed protein product [Rotaria sordida]|uniref:Uncharacterized protein n=2 Tax=Rotaria sordida TaxID=392033 RepID=A0A815GMP8_9BILA|nr:unnamed protein product [Rotaria sordida]CAF1353687.1 unnamed protein product [Rotaria sordida]CAF4036121.1 unnamed protein product [Rotaria sordida]
MADDSFLATLNEFIQITKEIIKKLNEELDWINDHHTRCNAAKTVGTTSTVVGATVLGGALVLAPFTGGASIVAATGYGALACTAGAAINITTDLTDMVTQRIKNSQIESICGRRNEVANRLKEHFDEVERVATELKALNVEEDNAYALSLWNAIKKGNRVRTSTRDIIQLSRCVEVASGASNMCLRSGGYFWKGMRLQSEGLMKALALLGFNVSKKGAMAVIRTGTVVLSGAFAIYDVYSLIQSIKNDHPTVSAISEIIKQMDGELAQIVEVRRNAIEMLDN